MWLREALNRQRAEKADNKTLSQTLKFLGYSYYKVGPYVGPCEILALFYLAWLVMTSFLFFTEFMRYIYPYSPGLFHELGGHSWWRHQMETFSALLAICAGNSPVTGEFPAQSPVTRSCDVFFDLRPNKRLSKHWRGWWFETPSRPLWRHCNVIILPKMTVKQSQKCICQCHISTNRNKDRTVWYNRSFSLSHIPQCIRKISHNSSFCNRNVHTCANFYYKMVHCGIWDWCNVGFVRLLNQLHLLILVCTVVYPTKFKKKKVKWTSFFINTQHFC